MTAEPTPSMVKASFQHGERSFVLYHENSQDHIFSMVRNSRTFYEREFLEALSTSLKPGDLVLDVGANIGNHTLFFAGVCGARVVAFEPNPAAATLLHANIAANGLEELVRVEEVALGEAEGAGEIENAGGENNLGAASVKIGEGAIAIRPLDAIELPAPPALIKIDVEGMDVAVLKGAEETLRLHMPIVAIEAADRTTFSSIAEFLERLGYAYLETHNYTPTHIFEPVRGVVRKALITRLSREMGLNAIDLAAVRGKSDQQLGRLSSQLAALEKKHADLSTNLGRIEGEGGAQAHAVKDITASIADTLRELSGDVSELRRGLTEFRADADSKDSHRLTQPLLRAEFADLLSRLQMQDAAQGEQARSRIEELAQSLIAQFQTEAAAKRAYIEALSAAQSEQVRAETAKLRIRLETLAEEMLERAREQDRAQSATAQQAEAHAQQFRQILAELESTLARQARELSTAQNATSQRLAALARTSAERLAGLEHTLAQHAHEMAARLESALARQSDKLTRVLERALAQIGDEHAALRGEARVLLAGQEAARAAIERAERTTGAAVDASLALGAWLQPQLETLRSEIARDLRAAVVQDMKAALGDALRAQAGAFAALLGARNADLVLQLARSGQAPDLSSPRRAFFDSGPQLPRPDRETELRGGPWVSTHRRHPARASPVGTSVLTLAQPTSSVDSTSPALRSVDDGDTPNERKIRGAISADANDPRVSALAMLNDRYFALVREDEIGFLTKYLLSLTRLELPDTAFRLARYLLCHFDEVPESDRSSVLQILARNGALREKDRVIADALERYQDLVTATQASYSTMRALSVHQETLRPLLPSRISGAASEAPLAENLPNPNDKKLLRILTSQKMEEPERRHAWNDYLSQFSTARISKIETAQCFLGSLVFSKLPKSDGPPVSIIMSAYNAQETVGYAIRSLLHQSYSNIEILVCDDESTDGTLNILSTFRGDRRLRVFRSLSNQGTYNIRNALIERARGGWVTFMDSDDVALPDRIEMQVATIENVGACFGNWLRVDRSGIPQRFHDNRFERFSVVSLMYERNALSAVGPYLPAFVGADTAHYEMAKFVLGAAAFASPIGRPLILALASRNSLTALPGLEAGFDGATSTRRQRLVDVASRHRLLGERIVPLDKILCTLRSLHLHRESQGVLELTASP